LLYLAAYLTFLQKFTPTVTQMTFVPELLHLDLIKKLCSIAISKSTEDNGHCSK